MRAAILAVCGLAISGGNAHAITWRIEAFDGLFITDVELDETNPTFVPNGTPTDPLFDQIITSIRPDDGTGFPSTEGTTSKQLFLLGPVPEDPDGSRIEFLFAENSWKEIGFMHSPNTQTRVLIALSSEGDGATQEGIEQFIARYAAFAGPNPNPGGFTITSDATISLLVSGDFDFDSVVHGSDLVAWQRNPSVGALSDWQANYGFSMGATVSAVPEPNALALAPAVLFMSFRRHHWKPISPHLTAR